MTDFAPPAVTWHGEDHPDGPLVVLLHGRGADEHGIIGLAEHLPDGPSYAAVRAPIAEGGGYAWFANRGIGRPVAESLAHRQAGGDVSRADEEGHRGHGHHVPRGTAVLAVCSP